MASNSFGYLYRITSFGESHGTGIGVVIDGCPAGLTIDNSFIQSQLNRRKPGQSDITSPRKEEDIFEIISGVFEGITTGAPLMLFVKNQDQRSADYDELKDAFRPGHADLTYEQKFGRRDHRGGGRSSARETTARVLAGAIAMLILKQQGITIQGYVSQVGTIKVEKHYSELDFSLPENRVRCPDPVTAEAMLRLIEKYRDEGNTIGGIVSCVVNGAPAGLGEPIYSKLQGSLAAAMLSINAAKGFDYGSGFEFLHLSGKELNDEIRIGSAANSIQFNSNHAGGIQGGISTGQDIYFRVAFKPVSTLGMAQESINKAGEEINIAAKGRHDPCVLPRAVPIVEAMCAIVLVDHLFMAKASTPLKSSELGD